MTTFKPLLQIVLAGFLLLYSFIAKATIAIERNVDCLFDAKKLVASAEFPNAPFANVDEAWEFIAGKFKSIYANPNNQIFETIWMNRGLRSDLFEDMSISQARAVYNALIDDFNSDLYQFIKIQ